MVSKIDNGVLLRGPLLVVAMGVLGIGNASPLPPCPSTLSVSQLAEAAPKGWEPLPYSGTQGLMHITFKLRTDPGELRPDEEKGRAGNRVLIWNVEGLKDIEQICVYSGTLVRLSRPVAGTVSHCEVREKRLPNGALQITSDCH